MSKVLYLFAGLNGIVAIHIILWSAISIWKTCSPYSIAMFISGFLIFIMSLILIRYVRKNEYL